MICTRTKYCLNVKIEKNEIGETRGAYGGEEQHI